MKKETRSAFKAIMNRAKTIRREAAAKFGFPESDFPFGMCLSLAWEKSKVVTVEPLVTFTVGSIYTEVAPEIRRHLWVSEIVSRTKKTVSFMDDYDKSITREIFIDDNRNEYFFLSGENSNINITIKINANELAKPIID